MLTDEQVRAFREDGFTVCEDFLSQTEVDALLQEADGAIEGNTLATHDAERMEMEPEQPPDGGAVRRLYEPCTYYPVSRALSEMDKLLDSVQQLFGPNLLFHYSKLNMKPAKVGSVVEWHQDLSYYPMTNRDSLAVLFYLDDTDATNGALKLIPKRHEAPLMQHTREGFFQGRVTEPLDESDVVMAEGQAGTAIFMHGLTPHASAPNTSGKPRRTLILAYRAADAIPLFLGPMTATHETHVRLVRGEPASQARFDGTAVALPRYKDAVSSLYDLQKKSREGKT
ncbi:MAG: phytanoyl-CoA dioxygenase family protein [Candidatus Latescibacterota bacterium]|nr:phytanoyl-CoA dioxygenase family protein [Candidatus Latescibacterota bacterium]MEE3042799.1 phytanoyl-CoA dioxygenase family protein [Candidatus Latescibacterota bacterium]